MTGVSAVGEKYTGIERERSKINYRKIALFLLSFSSTYMTAGEHVPKETVEEARSISFCMRNPDIDMCAEEGLLPEYTARVIKRLEALPDKTLDLLQQAIDSLKK